MGHVDRIIQWYRLLFVVQKEESLDQKITNNVIHQMDSKSTTAPLHRLHNVINFVLASTHVLSVLFHLHQHLKDLMLIMRERERERWAIQSSYCDCLLLFEGKRKKYSWLSFRVSIYKEKSSFCGELFFHFIWPNVGSYFSALYRHKRNVIFHNKTHS